MPTKNSGTPEDVNSLILGLTRDYPNKKPLTRGECLDMPRPCPFVSCRYHLKLEVLTRGKLKMNSDCNVEDMATTCALDVADLVVKIVDEDHPELRVARIAELLNVKHGSADKFLDRTLIKLQKYKKALGTEYDPRSNSHVRPLQKKTG